MAAVVETVAFVMAKDEKGQENERFDVADAQAGHQHVHTGGESPKKTTLSDSQEMTFFFFFFFFFFVVVLAHCAATTDTDAGHHLEPLFSCSELGAPFARARTPCRRTSTKAWRRWPCVSQI